MARFLWTLSGMCAIVGVMLNGIRIYASDSIWRQIVSELGAAVMNVPEDADVNIDELQMPIPVDVIRLKSAILDAMDTGRLINEIVGRDVSLPRLQSQIIVLLYKSSGMSGDALRRALGYASESAAHAVDTAIYELRRKFGREFIQNNSGVYCIGRI